MTVRFIFIFFLSSLLFSNQAEANDDFLDEIEITVFCLKDTEQIIRLELSDDNLISEENNTAANYLFKVCEQWIISDIQKYEAFFSNNQKVTNAMYALISIYENTESLLKNSRVKWKNFRLPSNERKHRIIHEVEQIKDRRKKEINNGLELSLQQLFSE